MAEGEQFSVIDPFLQLSNAVLYMEEEELGTGLLSITEDALNWKNYASNEEIWLKYPFIALHAVSRDATVFPFKPCVYLLYSVPEEDDSEQEVVTTYRLATQELDQLDAIFEAISDCQQLYPSSELSSDSADEGDTSEGFFTTAEGLQHLSIEGETVLNHLETILGVQNRDQESRENGSDGQFEDAEDA